MPDQWCVVALVPMGLLTARLPARTSYYFSGIREWQLFGVCVMEYPNPITDWSSWFKSLKALKWFCAFSVFWEDYLSCRDESERIRAIQVSLIGTGGPVCIAKCPSVTSLLFSVCSLRSGRAEVSSGTCFATTWWAARSCSPVTWKARSPLHLYLATK